MKFPWTSRAADEKRRRAGFERQLKDTQARRPTAVRTAAQIRQHDQLNGWTNAVSTVYGSPRREK